MRMTVLHMIVIQFIENELGNILLSILLKNLVEMMVLDFTDIQIMKTIIGFKAVF